MQKHPIIIPYRVCWLTVQLKLSVSDLLLGLAGVFPLDWPEELVRARSELLVSHAVNDDIPAAVAGQNPEGKKGKVAPFVPQNISNHKDGDGREGDGKRHRQRPDRSGCFDV